MSPREPLSPSVATSPLETGLAAARSRRRRRHAGRLDRACLAAGVTLALAATTTYSGSLFYRLYEAVPHAGKQLYVAW